MPTNGKDGLGWTLLHVAAITGQKDVAALLLADKADVNAADKDGWTPPHFAANFGGREVEEYCWSRMPMSTPLIVNRADVNAVDDKSETPLAVVALKGHEDLVNLLRQYGGHE